MTANPYCPRYTASQSRRIESGRKRLLDRWNTPKFTDKQPTGFRVTYDTQELDGEQLVDVFVAAPAARTFSGVWRREIDANAASMSVEHGSQRFTIIVAHDYYLDAYWWRHALEPDASCMLSSMAQLCVAAALVGVSCVLHQQ